MTTDGGVRGSVDQLAGSFDESAIADNASRPPSFASTHRWWLSGPELPDGDAEPSSYSLPQMSEENGWGGFGGYASRPSGADVDITQPLLENEIVLGALRRSAATALRAHTYPRHACVSAVLCPCATCPSDCVLATRRAGDVAT